MTEITIRPMEESDCPALTHILNDIIALGGTTAYETPFTADTFRVEFMEGDIVSALVAEADRPVGFQVLIGYGPEKPHKVAIATFADQSSPAKGIGRALFDRTVDAARDLGATEIIAKIRADNRPGLKYYQGRGFERFDIEQGVPLSDGTPVDRLIHRYTIPPRT